jgi:hypothetical protein
MFLVEFSINLCARSLLTRELLCFWEDAVECNTQTAGPFLRLRTLNCTPALSIIRPATPSSASISLNIVPFPIPPKLGLQEHTPMLSGLGVMSAVLAPDRAAPAHASEPAWPPPITTTSYGLAEEVRRGLKTSMEKHTWCLGPHQQNVSAADPRIGIDIYEATVKDGP